MAAKRGRMVLRRDLSVVRRLRLCGREGGTEGGTAGSRADAELAGGCLRRVGEVLDLLDAGCGVCGVVGREWVGKGKKNWVVDMIEQVLR
jgi:hypothetical protein